jgi:hypothetical protein
MPPQCVDGSWQIRRLYKQVIGIERGNGEHADAIFG